MDDVLYEKYFGDLKFTHGVERVRYFGSLEEQSCVAGWGRDGDAILELMQATCKEQPLVQETARRLFHPDTIPENGSAITPSKSTSALRLVGILGNSGSMPLSMSAECFTQLVESCKFPKEFAQSIFANNGSFARFVEYDEFQGLDVPTSLSVVVQTPYSPVSNLSLVIRVDIAERSAKACVLNYNTSEINALWDRLQVRQGMVQKNPLLLLSIVFEEFGYASELFREQLDREVARIERASGHTSLSFRPSAWNTEYEALTRDLHACSTDLIFMEHVTEFERTWGAFCKDTLSVLETLRLERGLQGLSKRETVQTAQCMDYHLNLSQMRKTQALALQKRVQLQINVLYSLISQRDSKVNLLLVKAAKRDSTAMKTISILTLVFLPGAFIASIFSAGIFDLQGSAVNISRMWWAYFVVAGCLTLVTVALWFWYMRWRSAEDRREENALQKGGERELPQI